MLSHCLMCLRNIEGEKIVKTKKWENDAFMKLCSL